MTSPSPTLQLASELIAKRSVTPDDEGCQKLMIERLEAIGFSVEVLRFEDVDNFWAVHGESGPILCFAGHTDVVPTGDESKWGRPPFDPIVTDDVLYGRGAADMKGSLASMVVAAEEFIAQHTDHNHRLAFLITSDEEGIAINGTIKVVEYLEQKNEKIQWCIVGEPSSTNQTGDVVKNGRRGSLGLTLTVQGIQGHVAYPHLANNPIHTFAPVLDSLANTEWDKGNDYFPATSFQISNIQGGTGATNVIPGELHIVANFRFSTELTPEIIQERFIQILDSYELDYEVRWQLSGMPFLTEPGDLVNAVSQSILEVTGQETELSTAGGTSDGRFIAPTGAQVVELGPVNATIHQVDEQVSASELDQLTLIYKGIMERLLVG